MTMRKRLPSVETSRTLPGAKPQYAVDRDGQRFLMSVIVDDANASSITIVENCTAGLWK